MKKLLWLDDCRNPMENDWLVFSPIGKDVSVEWAKDFGEFVDYINTNGLPDAICFDHDLGEGPSGHDAAKWLVDYCMNEGKELPAYGIQSANPVGRDNIKGLLDNFKSKWCL